MDSGYVSEVIVWMLNRVLIGDVFSNMCQAITSRPATPFPPHKFVQITEKHISMASLHGLESPFTGIPIQVDVLCVGPCCGVDELNGLQCHTLSHLRAM